MLRLLFMLSHVSPPGGLPYYQHYRFTFDLDEGTQRIEAMPTEVQVAEVIARFPEIPTGPYASLVDDEPDVVAIGLMPWKRSDASVD